MFFSIAGKTINDKCSNGNEKVDKADLLNAKSKNKSQIVCRRCQSLFFTPNTVPLSEAESRELKKMSVHGAGNSGFETVKLWWKTSNDLDFDTWGAQTVDGVKVIMCGDCEYGPVGLREVGPSSTVLLLAAERVKYI